MHRACQSAVMDLLERADALADLDRLLVESADGGRIAVVCGEAGAGKSMLATAFEAVGEEGAKTLYEDLVELADRHHTATDGTVKIPSAYVEVLAYKS